MLILFVCAKAGSRGHDGFMLAKKATSGAKWDFAMTEDQEAEWLGLHQWDNRWEFEGECTACCTVLGFGRSHCCCGRGGRVVNVLLRAVLNERILRAYHMYTDKMFASKC